MKKRVVLTECVSWKGESQPFSKNEPDYLKCRIIPIRRYRVKVAAQPQASSGTTGILVSIWLPKSYKGFFCANGYR